MRFVSLKDILTDCVRQPWAVAAFDTTNVEFTQAIVDAAVAEQSPLILMLYPGHTPVSTWPTQAGIVQTEAGRTGLPVAFQLDHALTIDQVVWGLRAGCSAVMVDGSTLPLDQNIALTRWAVELAHAVGVDVEAELGHVGYGDEEISADDFEARLTRVDEAVQFVKETRVDALAVSIGTVHGLYRGRPKLDFDRLAVLRAALDIPLVLHGGSDNPDPDMRRLIEIGIDKINIWTDVRIAYMRAVRDYVGSKPVEACQVHEMAAVGMDAICAAARQKIRLFGSNGKAA